MQLPTIPKKLPTFAKVNRLSKKHKITAGAFAAAAVVLTVTGLEATAGAGSATAAGEPTGFSVSTGTHVKELDAKTGMASQGVIHDAAKQKAQQKTDLAAAAKKAAQQKAAHAAAAKKAAAAAAERAKAKETANRSTHRAAVAAPKKAHTATTPKKAHTATTPKKATAAPKATVKHYSNNLDGWIKQSLDIMHKKGIPGTYEGIHRNIIRESSGNPKAINLWDINARNGIPSKGLLQVINPTFDRYHVAGTSHNIYDPVANITAACNYAADRYGTMDNVNSAY
jgi:transglycosylase-like protein with SLT domain